MSRRARWGAVLTALMAGCASLPEPDPVISGRLSVTVQASGSAPAQGFHAAFDLQGDGQRGRLDLSTPLGPRLGTATWTPGEAVLDDGRTTHRYPDLATLSRDLTGEPLPLQALPDWLRGRPWPGADHHSVPDGFEQLGWVLDTSRLPDGVLLASRAAPPAVMLRVRLLEPAT